MSSVTDVSGVTRVFEAIDEMKAEAYASYFAEDASFRFGNAEPIVGRQTIRDAMVVFFSTIKGLRHEVVGVWEGEWAQGDVYSVETEVTYTRTDDEVVSLPATSTMRMNDDLIQDWRIFADISPVYEVR
jgi:ketosteroid isomerase-like protein